MEDPKPTEKQICGKIKFLCYGTGDMIELTVAADGEKIYLETQVGPKLQAMDEIPVTPVLQMYQQFTASGTKGFEEKTGE